jgi:hypothetical protein
MNLSSSRANRIAVPAELLTSDAELGQHSSSRVAAVAVASRPWRRRHGAGLKTQPRFTQDLKLPQLRQQAANSA